MEQDLVLVYTDLVDSTALNARIGDAAMLALWDAHDEVSRALLQQWSGQELERTDGLLAAFHTAEAARGFAIAYHRAMTTLDARPIARVGVHRGGVHVRQNSIDDMTLGARRYEVLGLAKAVCARLVSLARGGQTLASAAVAAGLAGAGLSHGFWRFKGVDEPMEVFELSHEAGLPLPPSDGEKAYRVVAAEAGWVALRDLPSSLPAEGNRFFGRAEELRVLRDKLAGEGALVTVSGLGGMGKTRLAVRHGWGWRGDYPGGVHFCDLTSASGLNGFWAAVARGLRMPLGTQPARQVGDALEALGACLVVLDNFEQLAPLANDTVEVLRQCAPRARFLVTSRERLGLPSEQVLALQPLAGDAAPALFNDRAGAVAPHYLAPDSRTVTGPLVDLLDRLPLALELAAARSAVLPPQQLLRHMADRFRWLVSRQGRHDRQATLQATLEWSWELLSDVERRHLAALSAFEGAFNLAASVAVLDLSDALAAADALHRLLDKSLLVATTVQRFKLLACVREFAATKLQRIESARGAGAVTAAQRHQRHYAALGEQKALEDDGADVDDLVAACRHAVSQQAAQDAVACLRGAWAALRLVGPFGAAIELAEQVLALFMDDGLRRQAQWVLGAAMFAAGRNDEACQAIAAGLACRAPADAAAMTARLSCSLGEIHSAAGRTEEAVAALDHALACLARQDEVATRCQVMNAQGALQADLGRFDDARRWYEQAHAAAAAAGDRRWQAGVLGNLAVLLFSAGRLEEAREACTGSLEHARASGDQRWEGNAQCNLGLIDCELGRLDEASAALKAALDIARHLGHRALEVTTLCNLGLVDEKRGDLAQACRQHEAAVAGAQRIGDVRVEGQLRACLGSVQARLGQHEEARQTLERALDLLAQSDDGTTRGLVLCSVAENACLSGDQPTAAEALRQAQGLSAACQAPVGSELDLRCRRVQALLEGVSRG